VALRLILFFIGKIDKIGHKLFSNLIEELSIYFDWFEQLKCIIIRIVSKEPLKMI